MDSSKCLEPTSPDSTESLKQTSLVSPKKLKQTTLSERIYTVCLVCNNKEAEVKVCSRCRKAVYCSTLCQNKDYIKHRKVCLLATRKKGQCPCYACEVYLVRDANLKLLIAENPEAMLILNKKHVAKIERDEFSAVEYMEDFVKVIPTAKIYLKSSKYDLPKRRIKVTSSKIIGKSRRVPGERIPGKVYSKYYGDVIVRPKHDLSYCYSVAHKLRLFYKILIDEYVGVLPTPSKPPHFANMPIEEIDVSPKKEIEISPEKKKRPTIGEN